VTRARPGAAAGWLALALALAASARARADEGAARDVLCLRFEGPWSARLAALVDSDLRTAFGRRQVSVCPKEGAPDGEETPLLTLTLENEAMDRIQLTLEPRDRPVLERHLSLTPFPPDGRVLALVVAADELLQAWRERPAETPPAPPPPPPVVPERAPTVVRAAAPALPPPRQSLAVGFALEHYGGGQTLLGPDITWRLPLTNALFVAVAGQARRGLVANAPTGTVSSRLIGGRLALGVRLYESRRPEQRYERLALTADVGVRGGWLWFEGESNFGPADGYTTAGWLAYADAMLALDLRLGGPVVLRLAAGAGAPLVGQAAEEERRRVTAAWGVALETQGALLMVF
jgi:hypothetical protein